MKTDLSHMPHEYSAPPPPLSAAEEKLHALQSAFETSVEKSAKVEEKIKNSEALKFAKALFSQAPSAFIQQNSVADLKKTAEQVNSLYQQMQRSDKEYLIEVTGNTQRSSKEKYTAISTIVTDRSFVVDSLSEFLRARKLRRHVMLYPIVQDKSGRLFAITYFEIDYIEDKTVLQDLTLELEAVMADLVLVTEDHAAMLDRVDSVIGLFEGEKNIDEFSHIRNRDLGDLIQWLETDEDEDTADQRAAARANRHELCDFLRWTKDDNLVFLGCRKWEAEFLGRHEGHAKPRIIEPADLGLFNSTSGGMFDKLQDSIRDAERLTQQADLFCVSRTLLISPVHRPVRITLFTFKTIAPDGQNIEIYAFLGLLTSKSLSQEASSVPIIRRKVEAILDLEEIPPHSFLHKQIQGVVDSMSKVFLFYAPPEALRNDINLILGIRHSNLTKISVRTDPLQRSIGIMVILPRERYLVRTQQRIRAYLEELLNLEPDSIECRIALGEDPLARMHFFAPNPSFSLPGFSVTQLESKIAELSYTWDDSLGFAFDELYERAEAAKLQTRYAKAFPDHYKAATPPEEAAFDASVLEHLSENNYLDIAIRPCTEPSESNTFDLKIYILGDSLTLSTILPYLENTGLSIIDEVSTTVSYNGRPSATIDSYRVVHRAGPVLGRPAIEEAFLTGLKMVICGKAENDQLNRLMLNPGMKWQEIAILRVMQRYLWQIRAFATNRSMIEAIVQNSRAAEYLLKYFDVKFNPKSSARCLEERNDELSVIEQRLNRELKHVGQLPHDQILSSMLNVLKASVRTNYFQLEDSLNVALKIDCAQIFKMPLPRPIYEVYVNSPEFEGSYLRGGKVARGGIRLSQRLEDYRTEALDLMKAQMVKNSIIIPAGARGAFVIKGQSSTQKAKDCYCIFIRTLLQLTDNRADNEIQHNANCISYDGDDSYLVIATDRGTTAFRDVANNIAINEFEFWLEDAFATGGQHGYDHKKLAISARGIWETTKRHFFEIGVDASSQEFTVVGIGDMSGDVFGNGLLLSKNAKLIAAFNHQHIFVDPNPEDSKASFAERKRLFELSESNWTDYNPKLLSKGGGIYSREDREIRLSLESRRALGTTEESVSGQELIKIILTAPVDLLWHGGVGTYVKASFETNADVGDRTNDDVRVDARELRLKIVAEGGNLGLTQFARIEYSKLGGHINTDAVDNSGAVDCSDLEVNLKILLNQAVKRGELNKKERNRLLASLADDVCDKVLSRNRQQSKILSLGVRRSRRFIDYYRGLIISLEDKEMLDRASEYLPDDEALAKRSKLKAGLTRPELAVVLSYVKIAHTKTILNSELPSEPFLQKFLLNYFPKAIVKRFDKYIPHHPLAADIIATQVANTVVERMGGSFVYRLSEETGATEADVISAFLVAEAIADSNEITKQLDSLEEAETTSAHLNALLTITSALDGMTRWVIEHRKANLTWTETVERYHKAFGTLLEKTEDTLTAIELRRYQESYNALIVSGFPKSLAQHIASIEYGSSHLEVSEISARSAIDVLSVARLYGNLVSEFQVTRLLEQAQKMEPIDRWEALAVRTIIAQLRASVGELAQEIIEETGDASTKAMLSYLDNRTEIVQRFRHSLREFHSRTLTTPALLVITNQLAALARGSENM